MLKVNRGKITNNGRPLTLRGINLGGWLMMEGYMLGGRSIPEHQFKNRLAELFGPEYIARFTKRFRENFVQPADFKLIRKLGLNCVRLPFNYRLLEEEGGLEYLKGVVTELGKAKLYVILDMHAAPGAQNADWHSDSSGWADLWESKAEREKFYQLWGLLASTFKNQEWIAGYDIMNEAVTDDLPLLTKVYKQTIKTIRKTGDQHIIFLEGNKWAKEIGFLEAIEGESLALSIHFYEPSAFTFNWRPEAVYPGRIDGQLWNRRAIRRRLQEYVDFSRRKGWPVFVGEFGIVSRCPCCEKEFQWVKDVLAIFKELGFHWTYWTFKSVRGGDFPDGLYQLSDSSGLIGTRSIVSGMENFYAVLKNREDDFFRFWRTENTSLNRKLAELLKTKKD